MRNLCEIADIYRVQGDQQKDHECHKRSLEVHQAINDKQGIVDVLVHIATSHLEQGNY